MADGNVARAEVCASCVKPNIHLSWASRSAALALRRAAGGRACGGPARGGSTDGDGGRRHVRGEGGAEDAAAAAAGRRVQRGAQLQVLTWSTERAARVATRCVAINRGRASACAGVLRAREVFMRMDMCGVFCCGGFGLQHLVRACSCVICAWAAGHARLGMDTRSVGSGRGCGCVGPSLGAAQSAAPLWG